MDKDVRVVNLAGDVFIAEYKNDGEFVILVNPLTISVQQTPEGMSVGFVPYPAFTDAEKEVVVAASNVTFAIPEIDPQMRDAYINTFSPIDLPPEKQLVLPR